jgi:Leu/Phe-tRNA-protein transferase
MKRTIIAVLTNNERIEVDTVEAKDIFHIYREVNRKQNNEEYARKIHTRFKARLDECEVNSKDLKIKEIKLSEADHASTAAVAE